MKNMNKLHKRRRGGGGLRAYKRAIVNYKVI